MSFYRLFSNYKITSKQRDSFNWKLLLVMFLCIHYPCCFKAWCRNQKFRSKVFFIEFVYSDNQKTMEEEDAIITILKSIWRGYKVNSFTRHLKNNLFCEMGLFTLHNCCFLWSLAFLKLKLDFQSRLTIPEFSGYYCIQRRLYLERFFGQNTKLIILNFKIWFR